jgi:predicted TIM-barrel fold metal-dependent hydrolase
MTNLADKLLEYGAASATMPAPRREPGPRPRPLTIVSVDDHLLEPPDMFTGRLPARFGNRAPHVERDDAGVDWWVTDGERTPLMGADALSTWEPDQKFLGPLNFEQVRPATWQADARVADMDINGVAASLNFPSVAFGFAGQRFLRMADGDLGLASARAYNTWVAEEWVGRYPDRLIACQIPWLADVETAAAEIRANAERGFRAVAFTENPEKLGLPSIHTRYWDPFFAACEETETVVNLHVGSSSETLIPSSDSPPEIIGLLFPVNALAACAEWLYSAIPVRFPHLRIALSESGIGWVAMLIDKLEYTARTGAAWHEPSISPIELLRRNFWFSTFFDPRALRLRDEIGVDRIMVESDYPHFDSSWPDTQRIIGSQLEGFSAHDVDRITHRNACELYRHPLPAGWADEAVRGTPA